MNKIWNLVKNNPNRTMFLIPIILVAGISISHVVSWYNIANPLNWAIYLSVAIEVGAMTALVAATNKIKGGVWFMFGLITIIQMIGNIFYSFKEINENGELFKSWVQLTGPIWESIGTEQNDIVGLKRWLAFLEGGLLPIISLTSLHFFVKYEGPNSPKEEENSPNNVEIPIESKNIDEINPTKEDIDDKQVEVLAELQNEEIPTKKIWDKVRILKKEGKLPEPTQEDIENEPTALAFTPYDVEEDNLKSLLNDSNIEIDDDDINIELSEEGTIESINDIKIEKTLGEELTKSWNKILKKNNKIQRI